MKRNKCFYGLLMAGAALAGLNQSCISDMPFGDGEGTLRMQLVVNSDLTRAEIDDEDLRAGCVVYISGPQGLLYKYQGLQNVPDQLNMKTGSYVAEAWTGDSVPASFESKFYRGYEKFQINQNSNTSVVLTCKIANVVVSINPETVDPTLMKDWKITVSNSSDGLEFNSGNMDFAKGYYMMPNADIAKNADGTVITNDGWPVYTNLKYTIEGKTAEGKDFSKSGVIGSAQLDGDKVERAHEYVLNLKYDPQYEETGGSFVTIVVDDREILIQDEVGLYSKPSIKGVGFEIDKQITGNRNAFTDQIVKISAFNSIENLYLSTDDYADFGIESSYDLKNVTDEVKAELENAGITWDETSKDDKNLKISYITFSKTLLNKLVERNEEYRLNISVVDGYGRQNSAVLRIAVGEGAIVVDDPVVVDAVDAADFMAVTGSKATITGSLAGSDVTNAGIEYRKAESNDAWTFVPVNTTRAGLSFSVTITGLEPGTRYAYRAAADQFDPSKEREVKYFTTEDKFIIPNASMEDWSQLSTNNKVWIPSAGGVRDFWDTGNHGSATMSKTLTNSSTDMFHSGSKSAKLSSMFVGVLTVGKLAAGNLFVGQYKQTSGTDGIIDFGKQYNGSHPSALTVWANYRPVKVTHTNTGGVLTKNDMDNGQIYVAFTTEPITVNTGDKSTLFNKDNAKVLGYGEVTWDSDFGPQGGLQQVKINIDWKESAKKTKPLYMIIVCSASKYGDYFTGGDGSVMYLDDFEFVY